MGARTRRAVAAVGVLTFLAFYIWAAISIGERLPEIPLLKLVYFAVAGVAWGFPLLPLLRWAERG